MNTNYIIIRIFNNGNAIVELENKTIETNRDGANSFIALANMKGFRNTYNVRYENGDVTRYFN